MLLQLQPSYWSCVPTAFAMLFDMPVDELIREIGHDGSEVLWPELESTDLRKRAFHPQECIDVGFKHDIILATIHVMPFTEHYVTSLKPKAIWSEDDCLLRFYKYLDQYEGVMTGRTNFNLGHAVAWDRHNIYDPRAYIKPLEGANFNPQILYIKCRSKSS